MNNHSILLILLIFLGIKCNAQGNYVYASAGPSIYTKGDMKGSIINTGYGYKFNRHIGLELDLASGNNRKSHFYTFTTFLGTVKELELREICSTYQLRVKARVPVLDRKVKMALMVGGYGAYQVSSVPYDVVVNTVNKEGIMEMQQTFDRPLDDYRVGYIVELEVGAKITKRLDVGARLGLTRDNYGEGLLMAPVLLRYNLIR